MVIDLVERLLIPTLESEVREIVKEEAAEASSKL